MAQSSGKGSRKYGRNKRKNENKLKPLSRYVRGVITFEQYWKLISSQKNAKFKLT